MYVLQNRLRGYSMPTLSALRGLDLTLHDLIASVTWRKTNSGRDIKGLQSAILALRLYCVGLKSGFIFFFLKTCPKEVNATQDQGEKAVGG